MVGLEFSASLCQILPVLTHQTKMLVLPPRITDENRDTERLSILPHFTQLLRAGLRTYPCGRIWSPDAVMTLRERQRPDGPC